MNELSYLSAKMHVNQTQQKVDRIAEARSMISVELNKALNELDRANKELAKSVADATTAQLEVI